VAEVRDVLVEIISDVCRPDPSRDLSNHARSLFECGLDSMDFASVLMEIEDRFKVAISEDDLERVGSIDGMTVLIEERLSARR
jgi:acyl carrier protein